MKAPNKPTAITEPEKRGGRRGFLSLPDIFSFRLLEKDLVTVPKSRRKAQIGKLFPHGNWNKTFVGRRSLKGWDSKVEEGLKRVFVLLDLSSLNINLEGSTFSHFQKGERKWMGGKVHPTSYSARQKTT